MDLLLTSILWFSVATLVVSTIVAIRALGDNRRAIQAASKARAATEALEKRLIELNSYFEAAPSTHALPISQLRVELDRATTHRASRTPWDTSQQARVVQEAVHRGAISAQDAFYLIEIAPLVSESRGKSVVPRSETTTPDYSNKRTPVYA